MAARISPTITHNASEQRPEVEDNERVVDQIAVAVADLRQAHILVRHTDEPGGERHGERHQNPPYAPKTSTV